MIGDLSAAQVNPWHRQGISFLSLILHAKHHGHLLVIIGLSKLEQERVIMGTQIVIQLSNGFETFESTLMSTTYRLGSLQSPVSDAFDVCESAEVEARQ